MNIFVKSLLGVGVLIFGGYGAYKSVDMYGSTGNVTRTVASLDPKNSFHDSVKANTDQQTTADQGDTPTDGINTPSTTQPELGSSSNPSASVAVSDQKQEQNAHTISLNHSGGDGVTKIVEAQESQEASQNSDVNDGSDTNNKSKKNEEENVTGDDDSQKENLDSTEDTAPTEQAM